MSLGANRKWYLKFAAFVFLGMIIINLSGYDVQIRSPIKVVSIRKIPQALEIDIFDESTMIAQNDAKIINVLKSKFLIPPSKESYNLEDPTGDPSKNEGQNKYVLEIFNNMRGGFFVECGAWDGERLSTTLVLERDYGWTGFLAEPNSVSYEKLRTKNRKAWIANICLSTAPHPQLVNFGEVHLGGFLPAHSSIQKYLEIKDNVTITRTPCFPIFSVLLAIGVTTVDFFTLDIEGAELDVLKTIPFESLLIKIFCIEWNHIPEGKDELRRFVESKGYTLVKDIMKATASDFIFVHKSVPLPASLQ